MLPIEQPFKTYTGLDGKPLDNGYVYFGLPDQDPIVHPVTVYWDAAGTIPALQPLRTVNGYIMRSGTPANVFYAGAYSELVKDSKGRQVCYAPTSDEFSIASAVDGLAAPGGSDKIGHDGRTVKDRLDVLYYGVINVTDPIYEGGADPTGATLSTAAFQAALDAYDAAVAQYQASSPNVFVFSGPELIIPKGEYRCGSLTSTTGALRIAGQGAIIRVEFGATWITSEAVTVVDISGLSITGGARHFVLKNNNADGAVFSFDRISFHDTTDWPVLCTPVNPSGTYEVNHLSGVLTMTKCRWYNTNGAVKTYFDRTTIRDSYATLFNPAAAGGGRWQANRAAIENRSLGDGLILDNFFAVPVAGNGNYGNVWVDNYPGDAGHVIGSMGGAFDAEFIGGTAPVSYGGGVYAHGCRFGTETGGVPIVRNWCHGLGGATGNGFGTVFIVLDNCFQMASGNGGSTSNAGAVILKKGVPNAIVIRNCKGPVGEDMINAGSMVDLGGAASNLDYWLDAARCGNYRCTVNIEGINRAVNGYATVVPAQLIPYSQFDLSEDGRRRKYHMPRLNGIDIEFGNITMESDQYETFVKGTAFGGAIRIRGNSAGPTDRGIWLGRTDSSNVWTPYLKVDPDTGATQPAIDNSLSCGKAAARWDAVYAGTGSINTSDANEKQRVEAIPAAVLRAWAKVNFHQFKFNDAVAKKGDAARWHIGAVAQQIKAAFESEGVDPFAYGLLCYDEIPGHPDGGRYGVRYEEALALECAYLRSRLEA